MSSILKALKKLEDESIHQKMIYPWMPSRDKDTVSRTRFAFSWPYKIIITLCFLTVFLAMARWFTALKSSVSVQQNYEQSIMRQKTINPMAPDHKKRAIATASNTAAEKRFVENDNSYLIPDRSKQMNQEKSLSSSMNTQQAPSMTPSAQSTALIPKEVSQVSSSFIEERGDDSRLKLQAIAWSHNPEKRMAVINDQIVREGGAIHGVTVMHILEDQVIFREGEVTFKLIFGLK